MIILKYNSINAKSLSLILQIITFSQTLFMVTEQGMQSRDFNYSLAHLVLLLIFRQDILLDKLSSNPALLYIIVLIIVAIQKIMQILITFILYRIKDQERQFQYIDEQSSIKFIIQIMGVYQSLQITILHILFSTLCMVSFAYSFKNINDATYYVHLFFSLLIYIILQIDYIITYTICSTPLTHKYNYLDITQINILNYSIYLIEQILVISFCIFDNFDTMRLTNQILLIFLIIVKLFNQYVHKIYIFKETRQIFYFIQSFKLTITCYYFERLSSEQFSSQIIIPILIFPIVYHFFLVIDDQIHYVTFANLFKSEYDLKKLMYQLKLILNQCDIDKKMIPLKSSLINKTHRLLCQEQFCICSNRIFIAEIPQANAITQSILKQFIHQKIQLIVENRKINHSNYPNQQMLLIQTLFLFDFGWLTDSIKNLTQLLNCQINNTNFVIKQNVKFNHEESCYETSTKKDKDDHLYVRLKIQLNLIEYCRLSYILYIAKQKLRAYLGTSIQAYQQLIVSDFIQGFLKYDLSLKEIQKKVIEMINEKIDFYYKIIQDDKQNINTLGRCTKHICMKLSQLKKRLKSIYTQYPCISVQRCICFFQSELLNNYYEANKTTTTTSMQDDKIFRNKKIINYDVQVDQTAYAILCIKGELNDFQILSASPYFQKLVGRNKDFSFSQLLPRFMKNWHPLFIHKFFTDGQSRYYKSFNQSFVCTHAGLLKTVYLCYDITKVIANQNLVFAAFMQELPDAKSFLLIHGTNKRITFSENFFRKIGFDSRIILGSPQVQTIVNGLYLHQLIPTFSDFEGEIFQANTEMRFLDDKHLKEVQSDGVDIAMYILDPRQWNKEDQVILYSVSIIVTKRYVEQQSYLFFEFSTISKISKQQLDTTTQKQQTHVEITSIPSQKFINDSFASLMNLSGEAEPKKVNIFDVRMKEFLHQDIIDEENIASYRKDEIHLQVPFQSHRQLLSDRKKEIQQEFYNAELHHMDSIQQSSVEQVQKHVEQHNPMDDIQSQQSSVGGVKESQLFKKFEMIEKIIKKKKFNKMTLYLVFLLLQTVFFITFTLIIVTITSSELLQFIQEIDMISLHASVMAPHDMYLSIKVTISAYQQQFREKYIDNATLQKLIDPLYQFNAPYYFDLQENLFDVMQNQHLHDFFDDQYQVVYFMGNNDSVTYPKEISFRSELLAILNAQYDFKRTFDARKNANGRACQVLQFANYFNLQDKLEQLTDEILEFSKNRSSISIDKWFLVLILYNIIAILLGLGALFYKRNFLRTYEKLLSLFYFSDKNSLEQEILKLKQLLSLIQVNQEILSKYDFNFREREELVNKKKKEIQVKIEKQRKVGDHKLPKFWPIVSFLVFYTYFLIYSIIIEEETKLYLTKYKQTTDFYRLVQDLRFRSGNIYVYREIFFRWSNFSYMSANDLNRLYGLVDKSQNVIQVYLNDLTNLQNDNYLFSENYINFIDKVQNGNLCNFIDTKYVNLSTYCPIALDGVLLKGMISSLNYISKAIRSQQAINNFTKRAEVHFYELEGAQVICLAFKNVSQQLKQGMIDLTNTFNQTNEILSYLFMFSQITFAIIILTCFRKVLLTEFKMYKKSLYLIPIQVLLGDDSLERALRQFEFTEKI